jgi:hypothetical protein
LKGVEIEAHFGFERGGRATLENNYSLKNSPKILRKFLRKIAKMFKI